MSSSIVNREGFPQGSRRLFLMTNTFETGGSERQFTTLVKSLQAGPFCVQVGCIAKRGRMLGEFADSEDVLEFPVGGNLYGFASMRSRWQLARFLRRQKIQVVQAFDFYTNLLLVPVAKMARVPVVIGSCRQLGDLLTPAQRRVELAVLRRCDRVVCNSHTAAERLGQTGIPEARLIVIPNGLPDSAFVRPHVADQLQAPHLRVGMIARMNSEAKNHKAFLRMVVQVSARCPEAEFLLAGDGPLRAELEHYADYLRIRHRVRFLGDCADVSQVLRSLDVSVLPSRSESLSNCILESMAAGVAVVATDVGGNRELLSDGRGMLVPLHDENALVHAVAFLLDHAKRRAELGENAKTFAQTHFTQRQMQERYEKLYTDLLGNRIARQTELRSSERARDRRSLRVGIVAASSRYVGGQSVQAELLFENWKNDPEIEANLIAIDPPFPRNLRWIGRLPFLRTMVRQPFYIAALWRGLRQADIAHIFSASYWSFLIAPAPALLIARLHGCKTIVHYHSAEARDHLRRSRVARGILAKADRLVVPSKYLVDVFGEFGLSAQPIANIVDLRRFLFRLRRPLRPVLLCTRGFHPYYAVDVVVRAFALVKKEFPQAELVLAGCGPEENTIRNLVSNLQLPNVQFAGVISHETIAEHYEASDIFINASILDNMPVSIMEAFASGTPVVSTAPEGIRYLVEHERTGLLSEPGDEPALAQNVARLLRNPDLACNIALNAREHAGKYDWKRVRLEWIRLYRALAGTGEVSAQEKQQSEATASMVSRPKAQLVE